MSDKDKPGSLRPAESGASLTREAAEASMVQNLEDELLTAEFKAWDSLGRYKFQMFGYWASIWVHLNRIGGFKKPNPFRELVALATLQRIPEAPATNPPASPSSPQDGAPPKGDSHER